MKTAVELDEVQRMEFATYFYEQWNIEEIGQREDVNSPYPFGCPWLYEPDYILVGESIEEMARNYFTSIKDEIIKECEKNTD